MNAIQTGQKSDLPYLAYFSPLPPEQSGISDYSADILEELSTYFIIDVYIDDGYEPDCALPSSVSIYRHGLFAVNEKKYDHILYQMGNSIFHYYMYSYLRKYSGILVLHDYNMRAIGQYIGLYLCDDNQKTFREYLLEDYTEDFTNQVLHQIMAGEKPAKFELNGFVVNYAQKIIVHSEYAKRRLLQKDASRCVAQIPLYARIRPPVSAAEAKGNVGLPLGATVMAAFGNIQRTKRSIPLLKAAIRLLNEHEDTLLLLVGKVEESVAAEFDQIRAGSRVTDRIIVTGYVDIDLFCNYIDAADICFNLRHPYHGENSGSLARILSKGKCAVVNDIGSFGEIPDNCCIKLPAVETMSREQEEEEIYCMMKRLIGDPKLRERIGKNARGYAETVLDIHKVIDQYVEFIKDNARGG